MWMLYILLATLTAACVLVLLHKVNDRLLSSLLTGVIPAMALLLYLMLGRPDLPSQATPVAADLAPRHAMMLMTKPMQALEKNPEDMGALAALGELSARLGKYKVAAEFYSRAIAAAKKEGDPRLYLYKKDLEDIRSRSIKK